MNEPRNELNAQGHSHAGHSHAGHSHAGQPNEVNDRSDYEPSSLPPRLERTLPTPGTSLGGERPISSPPPATLGVNK